MMLCNALDSIKKYIASMMEKQENVFQMWFSFEKKNIAVNYYLITTEHGMVNAQIHYTNNKQIKMVSQDHLRL